MGRKHRDPHCCISALSHVKTIRWFFLFFFSPPPLNMYLSCAPFRSCRLVVLKDILPFAQRLDRTAVARVSMRKPNYFSRHAPTTNLSHRLCSKSLVTIVAECSNKACTTHLQSLWPCTKWLNPEPMLLSAGYCPLATVITFAVPKHNISV